MVRFESLLQCKTAFEMSSVSMLCLCPHVISRGIICHMQSMMRQQPWSCGCRPYAQIENFVFSLADRSAHLFVRLQAMLVSTALEWCCKNAPMPLLLAMAETYLLFNQEDSY